MKNLIIISILLAFMPAGLSARANKVGDSIPDATVIYRAELDSILRLNDDTTRVINFWATWCKPCVAELPVFF